MPPSPPSDIKLDETLDDAREYDHLRIVWVAAAGAVIYEISVTSIAGTLITASANTALLLSGLTSNTSYEIIGRSVDGQGAKSNWSSPLKTCTRPPTPTPPGAAPLAGLGGGILIWDYSALVTGAGSANPLTVDLGGLFDDGIHVFANALPIGSSSVPVVVGPDAQFVSRLGGANGDVPGGQNDSRWSAAVTEAFANLSMVGDQRDRRRSDAVLKNMRSYYARRRF